MNASADPLDVIAPERRLSGATLASLAFVTGTLFALLPMYYVYTSHDSASRTAPLPVSSIPVSESPAPTREASGAPAVRFAARMTYELSHTPAEAPPAAPMRLAAQAEPITTQPASALVAAPPVLPQRAEALPRVANARPIIASPPAPRDTTREMEREARASEYRESPRQLAQVTLEPVQPKVVEGRDFVFPGKPVATRPIAAAELEPMKRGVEPTSAPPASTRTQVATAGVVPGASPIGPPPEAKSEQQKAKPEAVIAPADFVKARLGATREWLTGAAQTTLTIQLMGSKSEEQLRSQLKALAKLIEPSKIYIIRTVAQGKPALTVLYGSYADRQAALQALDKLPAAIAANHPVLRTVNGIRAEQKQHGTDS